MLLSQPSGALPHAHCDRHGSGALIGSESVRYFASEGFDILGVVVRAFHAYHRDPTPAAVYNLGGGRHSNVSMLEAIELCQQIAGKELDYTLSDQARIGDHQWYIGDLSAFQTDYPDWDLTFGIEDVLEDIYQHNVERWTTTAPV
jgi:CDP-paratose 2-epimerase